LERKAANPVLDLKLFRNRLFAAGNFSMLIMFIGLSANTLLMPFYLIDGLEYPASQSGLLFASVSITALVVGPISGWLSDKIGYRLLCTVGIALMSFGIFWLSRLGTDSKLTDIVPRLVVMGIGSGLFSSPNNSSIMGSVPWEKLSTGSAMIATVRQVGMSSGIAIAGAIFTSRQAAHLASLSANSPVTTEVSRLALIHGYQDTTLIAALVCALAIFTSFSRGKSRPQVVRPPTAIEK